MVPLRRRAMLGALGTGIAAALAGCGGQSPKLRLRSTSAADLPDRASRSVDPDTSTERLQQLVWTLEQGAVAVNVRGSEPPLRRAEPVADEPVEKPVAFRGDYYAISMTGSVPKSFREVGVQIEPAPDVTEDGAGTIEYAELPAPDREAIDRALPLPEEEGFGASIVALYDEDETATSVLVPDQEYDTVRRGSDRYSVRATTQARQVQGHTYRYATETVATTEAAFVDWLRSAYRWEMAGLPDSEREIVQEATEEGGYSGSDDEAFRSLASEFFGRPALERDGETGEWLVQFDGEEYLAEFPVQRALD